MLFKPTCSECRAESPDKSPGTKCPQCLLGLGLKAGAEEPLKAEHPSSAAGAQFAVTDHAPHHRNLMISLQFPF